MTKLDARSMQMFSVSAPDACHSSKLRKEHKYSVGSEYPAEREIIADLGDVVKVKRMNVHTYTSLKSGEVVCVDSQVYTTYEAKDLTAKLDVCHYCGNVHDEKNPRHGYDCSQCGGN